MQQAVRLSCSALSSNSRLVRYPGEEVSQGTLEHINIGRVGVPDTGREQVKHLGTLYPHGGLSCLFH